MPRESTGAGREHPVRVLSVNVGVPREVTWRGKRVTTGIYKEPVVGRVPVRALNLEGDRQADLRVHGGPEKAVYAYPSEFYDALASGTARARLPVGTVRREPDDRGSRRPRGQRRRPIPVGTAELVATQPRLPCFKLGLKLGRDEFVTEFLERGLHGIYFAVAREGQVEAGDRIVPLRRDPHGFRVTEIARLYARDRDDVEGMRRAADARRVARELGGVLPQAPRTARARPRVGVPSAGPRDRWSGSRGRSDGAQTALRAVRHNW